MLIFAEEVSVHKSGRGTEIRRSDGAICVYDNTTKNSGKNAKMQQRNHVSTSALHWNKQIMQKGSL